MNAFRRGEHLFDRSDDADGKALQAGTHISWAPFRRGQNIKFQDESGHADLLQHHQLGRFHPLDRRSDHDSWR